LCGRRLGVAGVVASPFARQAACEPRHVLLADASDEAHGEHELRLVPAVHGDAKHQIRLDGCGHERRPDRSPGDPRETIQAVLGTGGPSRVIEQVACAVEQGSHRTEGAPQRAGHDVQAHEVSMALPCHQSQSSGTEPTAEKGRAQCGFDDPLPGHVRLGPRESRRQPGRHGGIRSASLHGIGDGAGDLHPQVLPDLWGEADERVIRQRMQGADQVPGFLRSTPAVGGPVPHLVFLIEEHDEVAAREDQRRNQAPGVGFDLALLDLGQVRRHGCLLRAHPHITAPLHSSLA